VLRVVSWNVLADAYVKGEYYPRSAPALFDRAARRKRVVERLSLYASADVLCLQEVDSALFAAAEEALGELSGRHFKKRGRGEGCAIFVSKARAASDDLEWREIVYGDMSGHVALGVSFASLTVVTTHLKWEPATIAPSEHRGVAQLTELLDAWSSGARVVCGDFNADPSSEVLAVARSRGLVDAYASLPAAFTANSNETTKRIDFILHTPDLRSTPSPLPPITIETPLPSDDEPSDHLPIEARLEP
jgi:endonuclease/exonuclease/phosphatase family metal-dependent hydrolase